LGSDFGGGIDVGVETLDADTLENSADEVPVDVDVAVFANPRLCSDWVELFSFFSAPKPPETSAKELMIQIKPLCTI
jgi:hypothetical protein